MATTVASGIPEFVAPGPGSWEMDETHVARPMFGVLETVFPQAIREGMRDCCGRYGLLLETLDVQLVNGFPYMQPRVVGAPAGGKPPPRFVLRVVFALMTRLHPEIRRRLAIAKTVFEDKPWRAELARWDTELRAATVEAHTRLAEVDVGALGDAALAEHLRTVETHACRVARQDHSMNMAAMLPLGDYLAQVTAWTGLSCADLMEPLSGYSPISAGDSSERVRLAAALVSDEAARALLDSATPAAEIWKQLVAWPGEVGAAARAFSVVFGNGLAHGLDVTVPTLNEQPAVLVSVLRESLRRSVHTDAKRAADHAAARVREKVPAERRETFDALLEEARVMHRLRDERHLYGAMPVFGIGRPAIFEAGRRLEKRGAIPTARHVLFARVADLAAALDGSGTLSADELCERARLHATLEGSKVPARLGPEPAKPPPAEWLPNDGARRLMRALDFYMTEMHRNAEVAEQAGERMQGLAASPGSYEGTARLCENANDLERVLPGDVLVAPLTSPAINHVLPVLGAIVTDKGGALSHAAIVSREYGIPCVVGTRDATSRIRDGQRVRVDGTSGTVMVLG